MTGDSGPVQTCIIFSSSSRFFLSSSSCFLFNSISALLQIERERRSSPGLTGNVCFLTSHVAFPSTPAPAQRTLTVSGPLPPACVAAPPSPSSSSPSPSLPLSSSASHSLPPPASSSAWRRAAALSVSPALGTRCRSPSGSSSRWSLDILEKKQMLLTK